MNAVKILQNLLNEKMDVDYAIGLMEEKLKSSEDKSYVMPVVRTIKAYKSKKIVDMCGHLRQCINYFRCNISISNKIYEDIFKYKNRFGFIFVEDDNSQKSVNISKAMLEENSDLKSIYRFQKERPEKSTISDGRLYRYYHYESYMSLAQKVLNYFISNMSSNETILACLPTGGGKSLSWQLPAISKAYNGMIIVVVPTVALAIDHEKTSHNFYESVFGESIYPKAYYSNLSKNEKKIILEEVKKGILPVLYVSPEALQRDEFKNTMLEAAKLGKVSTLIIDEVHLVVSWGMKFRPEFQLLSSFRRQLQDVADIRTILLSATLTPSDTNVIKNIFSSGTFTEFRADGLRTEPSYYAHECKSDTERKALVRKLVDVVPKPVIVYVVTPDQGNEYLELIKSHGYENVATFSGATSNTDRKDIIKRWNDNKIDIMVATSAFGMGVDKSDVRTIITAYIPESISRYYQEVGRAGRDGYSSLNYLLYNYELDEKIVDSLTKSSVITVELLVKRWIPLLAQSRRESSDKVWIDVNVPPEHLRFSQTGRQNAGWNKDIILLLYRARLIDILDYKITGYNDYEILIHLKYIEILENEKLLEDFIKPFRDAEKDQINNDRDNVKELLKGNRCYSQYFENEFPYVSSACSGCPFCIKNKLGKFAEETNVHIYSNKDKMLIDNNIVLQGKFGIFLKMNSSIMISTDEQVYDVGACVEFLIKNGINIIVVEQIDKKVLERLKYYNQYKYMILTSDEMLTIEYKWLNGICAFIYPGSHEYTQLYYKMSMQYLSENEENKVLHIADCNSYIESESKMLNELVDQNLLANMYFKEDLYADF